MSWDLQRPEILIDEIRDIYEPNPHESLSYLGLEHINQHTLTLNGIGNSSDTQSSKRKFKTGDILFGTLRPYFRKVIKARFDGVCSTDITVLRPKEPTDADFTLYFIANKKFIDYASAHSSGTRMPRTNWKHLSQTEWPIPEKHTRNKIGYILSAYDDLIENNSRRIKILEEMAEAIYREWFVKFKFPGHEKMRMVDSELGKIPEEWEITKLEGYVDFEKGVEPGSKNYKKKCEEGDMPFLRVGDLGSRNIELYIDSKLTKGKVLKEDDIAVSLDGTPGIVKIGLFGCYSTGIRKLLIKNHLIKISFLYFLMLSEHIQNTIKAHSKGTTILHAGESIKYMNFILPKKGLMNKFDELVSPMISNILLLNKKNKVLQFTRDLLLPKLISGEIDVEDLDIDVGELAE